MMSLQPLQAGVFQYSDFALAFREESEFGDFSQEDLLADLSPQRLETQALEFWQQIHNEIAPRYEAKGSQEDLERALKILAQIEQRVERLKLLDPNGASERKEKLERLQKEMWILFSSAPVPTPLDRAMMQQARPEAGGTYPIEMTRYERPELRRGLDHLAQQFTEIGGYSRYVLVHDHIYNPETGKKEACHTLSFVKHEAQISYEQSSETYRGSGLRRGLNQILSMIHLRKSAVDFATLQERQREMAENLMSIMTPEWCLAHKFASVAWVPEEQLRSEYQLTEDQSRGFDCVVLFHKKVSEIEILD